MLRRTKGGRPHKSRPVQSTQRQTEYQDHAAGGLGKGHPVLITWEERLSPALLDRSLFPSSPHYESLAHTWKAFGKPCFPRPGTLSRSVLRTMVPVHRRPFARLSPSTLEMLAPKKGTPVPLQFPPSFQSLKPSFWVDTYYNCKLLHCNQNRYEPNQVKNAGTHPSSTAVPAQ